MAKKKKQQQPDRRPHRESPAPAAALSPAPPAAPSARWCWAGGAALVLTGYALLRKADPAGQNAFAVAAAASLLAGYLLFIPAILKTYRD